MRRTVVAVRLLALLALLWLLGGGGCVDHALVPCGDKLCPAGRICYANSCAFSEQVTVCEGRADGDECTTRHNVQGHCLGGVCVDSICGDAVLQFGEACDDGNLTGGDGCSDRCDSNETCGNEVVDLSLSEQCDVGVPKLGGDGCSSRCSIEIDVWRDVTPQGITIRHSHVMVYDRVRQNVIVFGGANGAGVALADTWSYAGGSWGRIFGAAPPARRNAVMAFDEERGVAILFGGHAGTTYFNDTWQWDGAEWTELTPGASPSARRSAAMAYHPGTKEVVLFGGQNANGVDLADTWAWNGTTWTQKTGLSNAPSARREHAMALDRDRGRIVLYGGTSTGDDTQTWEWNGSTWLLRTVDPSKRPNIARAAVMAYDEQRDAILLYSGVGTGIIRGSIWRWDPANLEWVGFTDSNVPRPRESSAGAWVPGTGLVIMGGNGPNNTFADSHAFPPASQVWRAISDATTPDMTSPSSAFDPASGSMIAWDSYNRQMWRWNGSAWTNIPATTTPTQRIHAGFAWDERRGVGVGYGGSSLILAFSDDRTWIFDGTDWQVKATNTRPPSGDAELVYDSRRDLVVMVLATSAATMQTWTWNGTDWTQVMTPIAPPSWDLFSLTYDRARERVVLFGGLRELPTLEVTNQLWEFDGTSWEQKAPTTSPPPRAAATLIYDPARRKTVLFGGMTANTSPIQGTWEWNGTQWTRRPDLAVPPARFGAAATYDRVRRHIVVGTGNFGDLEDTWSYRFQPFDSPEETCVAADVDADGDGAAGCADPDCWGRCTPYCAPGETCDMTLPRCGDTTCTPVEDNALCPQDCPP